MQKINLQGKTRTTSGTIESYWFENSNINLPRTLFHRITIPLTPFDSGLNYVEQPEKTEFLFDWIELPIEDFSSSKTISLLTDLNARMETTIYIGSAHNVCRANKLELTRVTEINFQIIAELEVNFEHEGVGENELFEFQTELMLKEK